MEDTANLLVAITTNKRSIQPISIKIEGRGQQQLLKSIRFFSFLIHFQPFSGR